MTRDEMIEKLEGAIGNAEAFERDVHLDVAEAKSLLAALRSRPAPPDLSTRERQVLGRLVSEMEALSEPMYGEMRNALKKVLAWTPAPSVAETHPTRRPGAWAPTDGCDCERCEDAREDAAEHAASPVAAPAPETPAPDAMPEKRGHQIVARDRDGMPWCETCRKWGVREDGPCDRTYPGSTGRRQEAQP